MNLKNQYQIILDNITDGVYAIDLNWRITYFNRAASKITGIPVREAIGRSCFEVFRSNICESSCLLRETLSDAVQRPQTPLYNDVSLAISHTLHPLSEIEPEQDVERLRQAVDRALHSEGLL